MSNKEIAKKFRLLAALMELYDENSFKIKSYTNAAYTIERLDAPAADMSVAQLSTISGIGNTISDKIKTLLDTGTFAPLDQMLDKTPEGIVAMLSLKGIGPKKIKTLWQELGIENMGELLYACNENRLVALTGFGAKTQDNIRQNIEYLQANAHKYRYAAIAPDAARLCSQIAALPQVKRAEISGSMRRRCEIIEQIDLIIQLNDPILNGQSLIDQPNALWEALIQANPNDEYLAQAQNSHLYRFSYLLPHQSDSDFVLRHFVQTAHPEHLAQLNNLDNLNPNIANETDIYAQYELPYIAPELREGRKEIAFAQSGQLPELLQLHHLRGIVHAHSTYSDGRNTLRQMAEHCQKMGFEYLGISDHSKAAFYANGLSVERIAEQHREIDALNLQLAPFKIFKGIEADILNDGNLDYDAATLANFDFVIASIHSNLKMNAEKAMQRLLTAIENPHTTILGHPTGRLLLSREGYPIDHRRIIDACADNRVAIELNANPNRLDIDWRWIDYCLEKGVMISINPDAHSIEGISDIQYGVYVAQKGLLTQKMTLNALSCPDFGNYIALKRGK
jgi:DNA polymerase (family 10)